MQIYTSLSDSIFYSTEILYFFVFCTWFLTILLQLKEMLSAMNLSPSILRYEEYLWKKKLDIFTSILFFQYRKIILLET